MGLDTPVIVGGIIPEEDRPRLTAAGVVAVYTPKDFDIARIMGEIADLADVTPGCAGRNPLMRGSAVRRAPSLVRRRSTSRGPGRTRSS